jgi:hypothetical protein
VLITVSLIVRFTDFNRFGERFSFGLNEINNINRFKNKPINTENNTVSKFSKELFIGEIKDIAPASIG